MDLKQTDQKNIWHPTSFQKSVIPNIPIVSGKDSYLFSEDGQAYLDLIASWWVNLHGHSNSYINQAIKEQLDQLEQVIFAGFTHPKAIELSEKLLRILPSNQTKLFFSDDGSTAVEVALKMSLQYWSNIGIKKTKIISLQNAYHGDTFGAMSVSGKGVFTNPFQDFLFEIITLPSPTVEPEKTISALKQAVLDHKDIAAIIVEPLIQGAAGMQMYDAQVLEKIFTLARENDIIIIADEVLTGFGRTGKYFATDHQNIAPDILCLSKGLTGGYLPMGITSCTQKIYDAFYTDDRLKTLYHGHSFTANPLACAAACASFDLLTSTETQEKIKTIEQEHIRFINQLKTEKKAINPRMRGTILAFEVYSENEQSGYIHSLRDKIYLHFIEKNIILRPIGNTIYMVPPYCTEIKDLHRGYEEIIQFLHSI